MKCIKITNTHWLNTIAPQIQEYCKIVKSPAIYAQTMATSLHQSIQFGADASEVWAVFEENEPIAFARFFVMPLPYVGAVSCDCFHTWTDNREAIKELMSELVSFAKRHKATYIYSTLYSKKINDLCSELYGELGVAMDSIVHKTQINSVRQIL